MWPSVLALEQTEPHRYCPQSKIDPAAARLAVIYQMKLFDLVSILESDGNWPTRGCGEIKSLCCVQPWHVVHGCHHHADLEWLRQILNTDGCLQLNDNRDVLVVMCRRNFTETVGVIHFLPGF